MVAETGLCKDCKHWVRADKYESGYYQGLGRCAAALMFWDCTEWKKVGECARVLKSEYENNKAFVQDGSDYYAFLLTKPDFGCVQYKGADDV